MATVYIKDGMEFTSELALRRAYPELVFPKLTDEVMAMLGITKEERNIVKTAEAMAAEVRARRDFLLRKSDYYLMPDYPATEDGLSEVKAYRQNLRSIPQQSGFPLDVTWPTKPEVLGGTADA